jgi:16S rRNA (uracil1498-N3)-methyltransferase
LTTHRIYLPRKMEQGDLIELADDDFRYIKNVLRLKTGESIALFGWQRLEYRAQIETLTPRSVLARVSEVRTLPGPEIRIVLAQSLPKGDKMDFIIQKSTELGADGIIPFQSSRSIPRLTADKAKDKVRRWRKIALEASRQSGRSDIPEIAEIVPFEEMLRASEGRGLRLIFWEAESGRGIKEILRSGERETLKDFFIVVGPEGGFSGEEVHQATAAGMTSVSLGRQVLKVETASLAILSIIQYERGLIGAITD